MDEPLQRTLADAVALLESNGIEYALIGGLAATTRGQPRATADVDVVIAAEIEQAVELLNKLDPSPFRPLFQGAKEVVESSFILPLLHKQTNLKVDLSLGMSGFERQLIARAEPVDIDGKIVAVATAEDLAIMKALAGRPRDDQDLRGILVTQGEKFDWDYCERTARELGSAVGQDLVSKLHLVRQNLAD